jgi:FKBP-type peptidyl-prolyl cis-trans isomerase FklB
LAADDTPKGAGTGDRINYSLGYAFGEQLGTLARLGVATQPEPILRGILDALSGALPSVGREEMDKLLATIREPAADRQEETAPPRTLPLARTRGFVDDFARLNAKRPGVVTLPSGVQYEVLRQGAGRIPGPNDQVTINYEGSLSNGVIFDTTRKDGEPAHMRVAEIVVPGLREAVLKMREGDEWRIVIPPLMGFGRTGNNMLRKRDLIYEVELLSVEPAQTPEAKAEEAGKGSAAASAPAPAAAE